MKLPRLKRPRRHLVPKRRRLRMRNLMQSPKMKSLSPNPSLLLRKLALPEPQRPRSLTMMRAKSSLLRRNPSVPVERLPPSLTKSSFARAGSHCFGPVMGRSHSPIVFSIFIIYPDLWHFTISGRFYSCRYQLV